MTLEEARRRYQAKKRNQSKHTKAIIKAKEVLHTQKVARREHVLNLLDQGMSKNEVINLTGLSRPTINSYIRLG